MCARPGIDRPGLLVALVGAEHRRQLVGAQQDLVADLQEIAQHLGREVVGGQPHLGRRLGLLARAPSWPAPPSGRAPPGASPSPSRVLLVTCVLFGICRELRSENYQSSSGRSRRRPRPRCTGCCVQPWSLTFSCTRQSSDRHRRARADRECGDVAGIDLQPGAFGLGQSEDRGRQAGLVDRWPARSAADRPGCRSAPATRSAGRREHGHWAGAARSGSPSKL